MDQSARADAAFARSAGAKPLDHPWPSAHRRVLAALRSLGPSARIELAAASELSPATVTAVTAQLLEAGLIETGPDENAPEVTETRRGRPRVRLKLRAEAALAAGVKISPHRIALSLTDFVGEVVATRTVDVNAWRRPPAEVAHEVGLALDGALDALSIPRDALAGVGIGLPGFVDGETGVCHWSPLFDVEGVDFRALLVETLGGSVFIDNDANVVTYAERWFGAGRENATFVVVTMEHGVGMGAVFNGALYRGRGGVGGEFGHTKIRHGGALCRCGQRGCIEAYVSDYAILREAAIFFQKAAAAGAADPAGRRRALDAFIDAGLAGDAHARSIYARVGEILGVGLANLVNILSPEAVVLAGEGARAAPLFEASMRRAFEENALSVAPGEVSLAIRPTTDATWAKGAAAMVLSRLIDAPAA